MPPAAAPPVAVMRGFREDILTMAAGGVHFVQTAPLLLALQPALAQIDAADGEYPAGWPPGVRMAVRAAIVVAGALYQREFDFYFRREFLSATNFATQTR